ncbi:MULTISPECIES: nucleoside-diphosphate kinase [Veillonella]|jgi:nucleoside diphosphate kinase|uniref:Nucleoside diphosphate kinase n=1 Tax=Veillonella tobetsuensis TaxID=1110546 RepID=A0A2S7ZNN1_9FIRM|nr:MULTISPECIES: nucleoside-diphosphate kinase [Veillonella]MBF1756347.1 nucleoside-diphosphate kinase [Veillonella tobetsuensis]MDU5083904.1 nucleoside-diphosphate kinase [Veillonella sp.]PQL24815.1 nucleoside-diphosphate kinase [Veillonella tobetsuensis]GCL66640.1 nucleoside diphosphate kinase [Veillonella tobetsuensis]GCL69774.1 nucleoside diphosphate kinase [Veillonella tobetsuensis]
MEETLVLIKPDGVKRQLCGEILSRYERKGLEIKAMKLLQTPQELAEEHYAEHKDKPFFGELVDFITSGPVLAFILGGQNAVASVRAINGATNPLDATPGSIRGDYALTLDSNVVHASDSAESAAREMKLWFPEYK